jgi:hypothetical protein
MFLCYQLPEVVHKTTEGPLNSTKFGIATLECFATGFSLWYHRVSTGACGRVIGTQEREVPCITIGLCNKKCYKRETLLISAAGGVGQCLTP